MKIENLNLIDHQKKYVNEIILPIENILTSKEENLFFALDEYIKEKYKNNAIFLLSLGIKDNKYKICIFTKEGNNCYFSFDISGNEKLIEDIENTNHYIYTSDEDIKTFKYIFSNVKQAQNIKLGDKLYFKVNKKLDTVRFLLNWKLSFLVTIEEFNEFSYMILKHTAIVL
jgi:hypothetical protein